ncbi:MAG: metallophosphoesterase [Bacteroidales bacterium]|jgi:DNA repair exonuclease SbcCD nuclease subunit|nr:metallophosphoesterase [Bacteroidales bacterium]
MKISILHISDLHKEATDNYNNLFQSMKDDCDKYTKKGIRMPEIIVVSGDLIKGGTQNEIRKQYEEVTEFLNKLVGFFLTGDKIKIIIVPGNHDIDWNVSRESMQKEIDDNTDGFINRKKENAVKLFQKDSQVRWSWQEFCFYKIKNIDKYNERFLLFAEFYSTFYGTEYSSNPQEQFHIHDISQLKVAFVAFNSCYNNDHLNFSGTIKPDCITKASDELRRLHNLGRILIAVWHHNTIGLPFENNYMDKRILRSMIDKHIQIGLHGHQHKCQVSFENKNVFSDDKILIISSGTLYGNRVALPAGTKRQYNIIEIDTGNDKATITIHSREDKSQDEYDIPSWGEGRIDDSSDSLWTTEINLPPQPPIETILDSIIRETEQDGNYDLGISKLLGLDVTNPMVRKFLLDYLERISNYGLIFEHFKTPQNNEEAISLINAVLEMNDSMKKKEVLGIPFINDSQDASVKQLFQHLKN